MVGLSATSAGSGAARKPVAALDRIGRDECDHDCDHCTDTNDRGDSARDREVSEARRANGEDCTGSDAGDHGRRSGDEASAIRFGRVEGPFDEVLERRNEADQAKAKHSTQRERAKSRAAACEGAHKPPPRTATARPVRDEVRGSSRAAAPAAAPPKPRVRAVCASMLP